MGRGIFLMQDDGELVGMGECGYDSEALLQGYLARHHDLLAGDQIDSDSPRRWLLVSREMSLASEAGGSGRWSVDHLFLDQDAVPTIVETKRSSDTRIRREVVGQMLDYAANGVSYWDVAVLRDKFESNVESEDILFDFLENVDADPDEFWRDVERNLQARRVRLVFVSDHIPDELRRVVEFLNEQMNPAEVLAVEIKQYVSSDSSLKTFVPRVVGQTTKAKDHKSMVGRRSGAWDEATFFNELAEKVPGGIAPARRIFEWARERSLEIIWGTGKKYGTFAVALEHHGIKARFVSVWTSDSFCIWFKDIQAFPAFESEPQRIEFLSRLNEIYSIGFPDNSIEKYPYSLLTGLNDENSLNRFLNVLDWFVEEVRAT